MVVKRKFNSGTTVFQQMKRAGRECAVQVLYLLDASGDWEWHSARADEFWERIIELGEIPPGVSHDKVKTFAAELIAGVLEHRDQLDAMIEGVAENWRIGRMPVVDRNIARIGAYEIVHCPDVPAAAVLNEAIELAKIFGDADSARFINAVLDGLLKSR